VNRVLLSESEEGLGNFENTVDLTWESSKDPTYEEFAEQFLQAMKGVGFQITAEDLASFYKEYK
jgi:hypothetical protein